MIAQRTASVVKVSVCHLMTPGSEKQGIEIGQFILAQLDPVVRVCRWRCMP
jgi:hypothetical protein